MAALLFTLFFIETLTNGHLLLNLPENKQSSQWQGGYSLLNETLPSDQPDPEGSIGIREAIHNAEEDFKRFISKFNKQYESGSKEFERRFGIFQKSLDRVNKLKEKDPSYGITHFADLSVDEFQSSRLFTSPLHTDVRSYFASSNRENSPVKYSSEVPEQSNARRSPQGRFNLSAFLSSLPPEIPKKVDWRDEGIISAVINQGKCGACWAYSSLETIESMAVKLNVTPPNTQLSSAQLINCGSLALPDSLKGCEGGDVCAVLSWLKKHKVRIMYEDEYIESGPCHFDHGGVLVSDYQCKNYIGREDEMIRLLATHGPLTAAVDATTWQDYLGGTIKYHCESRKTHAVQIVGYNLEDVTPYYIVKNSWGKEFGLNGYLHIAIGSNLCGIAEDVSSIDVTA